MFNVLCEDCRHKSICKWTEEYESTRQKVIKLSDTIDSKSPIAVNIRCGKYEKATTVREEDPISNISPWRTGF